MNGLIRGQGMDPAGIALATGGRWVRDPAESATISGASIDTREIIAGNLFFAFPGERVDGHDFVRAAAEAGASAVVVERDIEIDAGVGVLRVASTRGAIAALAGAYRRALKDVRVIGVTGSNGKTTTVRMIDAALRGAGMTGTHATKSHNNDIGVPLTILNARRSDGYLVCEVGTSAPGEIRRLAAIAAPDIAVITSIGRAHLENLGSVAGIAAEKADLVRSAPDDGVAVVIGGSPELDAELARGVSCRVVRAGEVGPTTDRAGSPIDCLVTDFVSHAGGSAFSVSGHPVRLPLPGAHNACNAAIAFGVAIALGCDPTRVCEGLAASVPPQMRLEVVDIALGSGTIRVVNDAYNANPDSMLAGLGMLAGGAFDQVQTDRAESDQPRRVAVLGDMLEMGPASAEAHREIAVRVAGDDEIDLGLFVGEQFAEVVGDLGPGCELFPSREEWTDPVAALLRPGDVVLLKGSRGMRLERLIDVLRGRAAVAQGR
mgnify:CR=1 FL=1